MQALERSQLNSERVIPNCENLGISSFLRFWLFSVLKVYSATEEYRGRHSFLLFPTHSPDEPHHIPKYRSWVIGRAKQTMELSLF